MQLGCRLGRGAVDKGRWWMPHMEPLRMLFSDQCEMGVQRSHFFQRLIIYIWMLEKYTKRLEAAFSHFQKRFIGNWRLPAACVQSLHSGPSV